MIRATSLALRSCQHIGCKSSVTPKEGPIPSDFIRETWSRIVIVSYPSLPPASSLPFLGQQSCMHSNEEEVYKHCHHICNRHYFQKGYVESKGSPTLKPRLIRSGLYVVKTVKTLMLFAELGLGQEKPEGALSFQGCLKS